jgi:hypothetical protein
MQMALSDQSGGLGVNVAIGRSRNKDFRKTNSSLRLRNITPVESERFLT